MVPPPSAGATVLLARHGWHLQVFYRPPHLHRGHGGCVVHTSRTLRVYAYSSPPRAAAPNVHHIKPGGRPAAAGHAVHRVPAPRLWNSSGNPCARCPNVFLGPRQLRSIAPGTIRHASSHVSHCGLLPPSLASRAGFTADCRLPARGPCVGRPCGHCRDHHLHARRTGSVGVRPLARSTAQHYMALQAAMGRATWPLETPPARRRKRAAAKHRQLSTRFNTRPHAQRWTVTWQSNSAVSSAHTAVLLSSQSKGTAAGMSGAARRSRRPRAHHQLK